MALESSSKQRPVQRKSSRITKTPINSPFQSRLSSSRLRPRQKALLALPKPEKSLDPTPGIKSSAVNSANQKPQSRKRPREDEDESRYRKEAINPLHRNWIEGYPVEEPDPWRLKFWGIQAVKPLSRENLRSLQKTIMPSQPSDADSRVSLVISLIPLQSSYFLLIFGPPPLAGLYRA